MFLPLTVSSMGIIPALAGNTQQDGDKPPKAWDHPRSRGEYLPNLFNKFSQKGSSPLSRGIRVLIIQVNLLAGIIPALAGNTVTDIEHTAKRRDHPRSRGEYVCGG